MGILSAIVLTALVAIAIAPSIVAGTKYGSPALAIWSLVGSVVGAFFLNLVFMLIDFAVPSAPGPGAEGNGCAPVVYGPLLGWILGGIAPVWLYRRDKSHRRQSEAALTNGTGPRRDPFDYGRYTLSELEDAAAHVNRVDYPERAREIEAELARRRSAENAPHQDAN